MTVEVVLLKKVQGIGEIGDIVSVKEGYARNYLLVLGLAQLATDKVKGEALAKQEKQKQEEEAERNKAKELAKNISSLKVTLERKTKEGKLFGSVRASDLTKLLDEKGFKVRKNQIKIKEGIKEVGEYEFLVEIASGIEGRVKLEVISEEK